MYSLVLMSAMSTTPATPQFNGFFRDLFFGCCGGCYGSCYGSGYGSCYGCYGGGCDGFLGFGLVRRPFFSSCYGCYGSGYGSCYGSGYGSCYGTSYAAPASCYGSSYSCFGSSTYSYTPSYGGCYGGSAPLVAAPTTISPNDLIPSGTAIPTIPYAPVDPAPAAPERSGFTPANYATTTGNAATGARATVIVKLPADAKLYAEGKLLTLTSAERRFVTPPLPAGEFAYRFKVEFERDGETYSATKKVPVKAGGTVTVEFTDSNTSQSGGIRSNVTISEPSPLDKSVVPAVVPSTTPATATPTSAPKNNGLDRATITVKLPPGATLYIDDKKSPSAEPVRQFTTPPLPSGKEYAYNMKAEVMRDGRPESITQQVKFRAGDKFTVDFTTPGK